MRHLVLGPVSGLVVLLLLLLMVQLAGLGGIKQIAMPPMQAPASFNISDIDFNPTAALSISEFDPLTLPAFVQTQVEIPEITLALDFDEPELDISLAEPQVADIVLEELFEPLENGLVEIPKPIPAKAVVPQKKQVKKTTPAPTRVEKKPVKKIAQKPTDKVLKAAKKSSHSKASSLTSTAANAEGGNTASNTAGAVTNNGSTSSKPISRVRPTYPKRARRRGIEGEVVVSFLVNSNGLVDKSSLRITSARPAKVFNKAVLKAVARWKFTKVARAYRRTQRLVFKLDK